MTIAGRAGLRRDPKEEVVRYLATILARVAGLALLLVPPARGAEGMATLPEELAVTESIVTQDEDELQTSLRAGHLRFPRERSTSVLAQLEYGVTDRLQAILAVPYGVRDPSDAGAVHGLEDVDLGFRYAVLDFRTRPLGLDLGLTVGLPTGSRRNDLGTGDVSLEPTFTLSRWLGPVNGQLSFSWRRSGIGGRAETEDEFKYNVALLYPWRQWFLTFEGAGETEESETTYYAIPELVWKPGKYLELLLAVPVGLTDAAADYGVIAGITVEIERLTGRGRDVDRPPGPPRVLMPYAATDARRAVATAAAHATAPNPIATPSESASGGSPGAAGSRQARSRASP